MALRSVLSRRPQSDVGLTGDHRRLLGLLCGLDGGVDRFRVVAIDFLNVPARCFKAHDLIGLVRQFDSTVDGDVVVVPEDDQLAQFLLAGKADGFLADAFHQAAVAGDDVGVVVNNLFTIARA